MFGKAKKGEEAVTTKEKGAARGLTIVKLSLPPILLVVLLVLACGYFAYRQYAGLAQDAQQVKQQAEAQGLAAQLGSRAAALANGVALHARADAALAEAVAGGDSEALRRFEQGLSPDLPGALLIRVVTPADTSPDESVAPPIGYATLDLARQAEAGKQPPLEVHLYGSKQANLALLRPINYQGRVIASLLVSYKPTVIKQWLAKLTPGEGYVELQQGSEGPLLGSAGDAGFKHGDPVLRAEVPGSSWQLVYWPSDSIGMADMQKLAFLLTFVVAAVVIALVMFLYALYLSSTIKRELHSMANFMVESGRGTRFHSYPVKMAEMERTLQEMEPVLSWLSNASAHKVKAAQEDEGPESLTFMDFGEIAVEESDGEVPQEEGGEKK